MFMGAAGNSACNDSNIFTSKFVEAHHYSLLVGIEGDNHYLHMPTFNPSSSQKWSTVGRQNEGPQFVPSARTYLETFELAK